MEFANACVAERAARPILLTGRDRRLRKVKAGRLGDRRSRAASEETQFSSINAQLPANNVITGAFKLLRDAYDTLASPSALALR